MQEEVREEDVGTHLGGECAWRSRSEKIPTSPLKVFSKWAEPAQPWVNLQFPTLSSTSGAICAAPAQPGSVSLGGAVGVGGLKDLEKIGKRRKLGLGRTLSSLTES